MNTTLCKNCGQANLPNAERCSKCGKHLSAASDNPFSYSGEPPRNAAFPEKRNEIAAGSKSGSKMLYWILGGVAALVLVSGFILVAAIGIYLYTSQNYAAAETTNAENTPAEKKSGEVAEIKEKRTVFEKIEPPSAAGNLEKFISDDYQKIGDYRLQSVSDIKLKSKKIFRNSTDEAFAVYSSDEKNPLEILFSIAKFKSVSDAKVDVVAIKIKALTKKGKILRETKLSDGVVISYTEKNLIGILDCKNTTCARVLGIDNKKVADFYKKISGK